MTKQGMWQDPYCCIGDCPCHSPKVELPKWDWESEFSKFIGKPADYHDEMHQNHPCYYTEKMLNVDDLKKFIYNILSLSTTQLVEKIKGECEKDKCECPPEPKNLDPRKLSDIDKLLKYVGRFNYNKAIDDLIKIISKYK
jgi:hypothetical protein